MTKDCICAAGFGMNLSCPIHADSLSKSDTVAEQQSVAVSRFELNYLRNFVVALGHYAKGHSAAGDLQRWIDERVARPAIASPTQPEPELGKLLDEMMQQFAFDCGLEFFPLELPNYSTARQAVEEHVSRLAKDTERLNWLDEGDNFYMVTPATNMIGVPKGWTHRVGRPLDSIGERCLDLRDAIDKARISSRSGS